MEGNKEKVSLYINFIMFPNSDFPYSFFWGL